MGTGSHTWSRNVFAGEHGGGVGSESAGAGMAVMGADSEIKCCS